MYDFAKSIFPICRSITGDGVRETLAACSKYIEELDGVGFEIKNVASGTACFDWTVPKEWRIREAYIEDEESNHIIDMARTNLHVIGYSTPVDEWVDFDELKTHIFTLPDQPDYIPYVTSYYRERYGFCMSANALKELEAADAKKRQSGASPKYHMYIDSELFDGNLTYAELILPGESQEEVFFSTYDCHPSMANNECSGPTLMVELINYVKSLQKRRYTYRFIIVPETIGSITYLATGDNLAKLKKNVVAGFNLSCVGDERDFSIVESKYGNTLADKVLKNVLEFKTGGAYSDYSFLHRGSDERQYNSVGVELPVVCYCRSKFGAYPEYHTSADDMTLVSPAGFQGSYEVMVELVNALEYNHFYKTKICCEPQLGKRGLYPSVSIKGGYDVVNARLLFAVYADGTNDLIDISNIIKVPVDALLETVDAYLAGDLIEVVK